MANVLFHLPPFSCIPKNILVSPFYLKQQGSCLQWAYLEYPFRDRLSCVCFAEKSSKKGKARRPAKRNEELCHELREFISVIGLAQNHVPSMKELSEHGRKDLANIVRRRGYKVIAELLMSSAIKDAFNEDSSAGKEDLSSGCKDDGSEDQESNLDVSAETVPKGSASLLVETSMLAANGTATNSNSFQVIEPSKPSIGSLHAKATNFIRTGELDMVDDANKDLQHVSAHEALEYPKRDDVTSGEQLHSGKIDDNLGSDMNGQRDRQTEIDLLKFMLNQKERELSQLKQQVEKEKHALSILQDKVSSEIGNAHRIISEKDLELRAAEETLSGLKEVLIEFWTNGKSVEVAGSFNGWHHKIRMDVHSSSNMINSPGSRKSALWSTMLWLYPGTYEIKFIVDGHWMTDSRREMIASGNTTNNVLRVDG